MERLDAEARRRERILAAQGGDESTYFQVLTLAEGSGDFSAEDPLGLSRKPDALWTPVPARVTWGASRSRVIQPDGGGGYIFISVTATIMDVPASYLTLLDTTRVVKIAQYTETGEVWLTCRIIDINHSHRTQSLTVRVTVDLPSQE